MRYTCLTSAYHCVLTSTAAQERRRHCACSPHLLYWFSSWVLIQALVRWTFVATLDSHFALCRMRTCFPPVRQYVPYTFTLECLPSRCFLTNINMIMTDRLPSIFL
ncbi:hypothetical protein PISMIDRAFT_378443 [Pisolithus microcarpus 441]|uniref:Uncharacterized protein n=1 Tax=Pisolithus microcarpus 441 TaxID=765257 RepID=A0A0C9XMY3_9AGAM|nr:hypothetical protein BKA83DRAFT_378443 [Pisolithus microcarpus]KIK13780.1 hypothetical protein PISMIDRAFT_378443 [Pisolithus microcarpus 441]